MVPTRLAELKPCSKPFPDIPRIFALSRPTGAKGGAAAGCRRKFRESFPPLCSDGRGKLAVGALPLRFSLPGLLGFSRIFCDRSSSREDVPLVTKARQ